MEITIKDTIDCDIVKEMEVSDDSVTIYYVNIQGALRTLEITHNTFEQMVNNFNKFNNIKNSL